MCGKPGYSTENTPSKKTSLRWGDDCPNISLADTNSLAAISSSSSFVAKFVVISFKGKKNRNRVSQLSYIIYKLCKSICIIDNIGFIFFHSDVHIGRTISLNRQENRRNGFDIFASNTAIINKNFHQGSFLHLMVLW